ncbi:HAD-IA family hydrolase [Peterkaempfera bronchialis]|uniref:HAD family hydrolase n=1 Tax=Peterkaempfera bronchialis TaxID=2126346 RepID=A0A345T3W0_9ACTN|nr:HAD-IA family hydrolase [Peterkaempfera bronchialis]AXI80665.1 HAD family hydrolase [Peterkaempfera bronchialis]
MDIAADALLFDMDGTLVDSTPAVHRCWTAWMGEYGLTEADFARILTHGRPAVEIIRDVLPPAQLADGGLAAALRRIEELEVADTEGTVALPGAAALLESLPTDRWAVVTSATRALAEVRLAASGLPAPLLVTADDITRGKPDPEPFLLAARQLGVDPARCLVVEDAPAGLAAARAAGMRSVAVTTTHDRAELAADVVVEGLHRIWATDVPSGLRIRAMAV